MKNGFLIFLFFYCANFANAQTKQQQALAIADSAITLMKDSNFKAALQLWQQASVLDIKNSNYPFETANCYYELGEFKKAIPILEKLVENKEENIELFHLLGNCYDNEFMHDKAIVTYKKGLKLFPKNGNLYLEIGIVYLTKKELIKALTYFEKGIQVEPNFASNYYYASKLFCQSDNKIWGLIYGELFMNIETNTKRTQEISKLMFTNYKIIYQQSNTNSLQSNNFKDNKFIENYYKLMQPIFPIENNNELKIINKNRTNFLNNYVLQNTKEYQNALFSYQQSLQKAGVFTAYNYWLLNQGNTEECKIWISENSKEFKTFLNWFATNPIVLDGKELFHRVDYP